MAHCNPSEDDQALWSFASATVMSDEETDDDGTKTFRRPRWRNLQLTNLITRIDEAGLCVRNYSNTPASRVVDANKLSREVLDLEEPPLDPASDAESEQGSGGSDFD